MPEPTTSPSSSRSSSPDFAHIDIIVSNDQDLSAHRVMEVEPLHGHLHRLYALRLSNDQRLVMKGSPSRRSRLLRQEVNTLENEAESLRLISKVTSIPVPRLLHQHTPGFTNHKFLLTTNVPGTQLSKISEDLGPSERDAIDRRLGEYLHNLSLSRSASFGPISRVHTGRGSETWGEAFTGMIEEVLRDAECSLIHLPYSSLREYIRSSREALDEITDARLLRLDPWDRRDVFVDEETLKINGIINWTNIVYGDPFATEVLLSHESSEAMLEGFGQFAEISKNAQRRKHLYSMYHALIAIVSQCFRPRSDATERDGRRRLTSLLIEIGAAS